MPDPQLFMINKFMKQRLDNSLTIKCKYECPHKTSVSEIAKHEKDCPHQAFFCPNQGCYQRIPAKQLEDHLAACEFEIIECSRCAFKIHRREDGHHDCVDQIKNYLAKNGAIKTDMES